MRLDGKYMVQVQQKFLNIRKKKTEKKTTDNVKTLKAAVG